MRGHVFALVLALILSASTAIAAPIPKAGASCTKQGLSNTYKGNKFTCIKSGKKLVWSKGVPTKSASEAKPSGISQLPTPNPSSATDPRDPQNLRTVTIHYKRTSGDYRGWNLWIWRNSDDNSKDYAVSPNGVPFQGFDDFGAKVSIPINSMREFKDIGFYLRLDTGRDRDIDFDRFITQFNSSGFAEIWLIQNDPNVYTQRPDTGESPKPTPSPSSAPTPTPTPTPTPSPTPTPTPKSVADALKNFGQFPKSKDAPQKVIYNFGPNAEKSISDLVVKSVNGIIELFVDFYQHPKPFQVWVGSPSDREWMIQEWSKNGLTDAHVVKNVRSGSASFTIFPSPIVGTDVYGTVYGAGGRGTFTFDPPPGDFSTTMTEEELDKWRFYDGDGSKGHKDAEEKTQPSTITHHIIHSIQSRITGGRVNSLGCWGAEGGAEFYGALSASRLLDIDYLDYRSKQLTQFTRTWPVAPKPGTDLRNYDEKQWLDTLKSIECVPADESVTYNLQYSVGLLLYERLMQEFGHQKIMEWWFDMRNESRCVYLSHEKLACWKAPFKRIFGIDVDSWYRNSAIPYLMGEYKAWVPPTWWTGVGGVDYRERQQSTRP